MKHAGLEGTNEVTLTVNKADFPNNDFAYLSLSSGNTIDLIPETRDLVFTRYTTPLDDGEGNILQYLLTGTLANQGIEIAQADEINPDDVEVEDYLGDFAPIVDEIGANLMT